MKRLYHTILSTIICLGPAAMTFAQEAAAEEEVGKSYVASYFIVGLGLTLGLVAVCTSAGRRKEVRKPE